MTPTQRKHLAVWRVRGWKDDELMSAVLLLAVLKSASSLTELEREVLREFGSRKGLEVSLE